MKLKQPDKMTIYPQRDSNPDYLLCWIPKNSFGLVTRGNAKLQSELEEIYPSGIETEFSKDGFDELGISLPREYDLDEMRKTFIHLSKSGLLEEVKFISLENLQELINEKGVSGVEKLTEKLTKGVLDVEIAKNINYIRKVVKEPPRKGDEDPRQAFRRLSGELDADKE